MKSEFVRDHLVNSLSSIQAKALFQVLDEGGIDWLLYQLGKRITREDPSFFTGKKREEVKT